MADEKTRGDALRQFLTGADSAGGSQSDPDASLGDYRSSTEVEYLGVSISSAISGITINHVAGKNGTGDGTLDAPTADSLQWTPPDGSAGPEVSIADGETKVLEGDDSDKWIRVSRTSSDDLSGTATVTLNKLYNNVIGFDNVSSDEAGSGIDEVRAVCDMVVGSVAIDNLKIFLNELGTEATTDDDQLGSSGSGTIGTTDSFDDWPETGYARIEESDGTLREIVYYSSRTDSELTVPGSDARGLLGTSASAGASDDEAYAVPGLRLAIEYGDVGSPSFDGSDTDDLSASGDYKGQEDRTYRVEIDDASSDPETFRWSPDGGSTWEETGVEITGSAQSLAQGVEVTFDSTTGHDEGDYWDISCTAAATDAGDEDSIPDGLSWETGITPEDGLDVGTLEADEQVFLWLRRTVPADAESNPDVVHDIARQFDSA